MRQFVVAMLLLYGFQLNAQWDDNAGLIPSLLNNADISVSSGENLQALTDGDPTTMWESTNALPTNYLTNSYLNAFLTTGDFRVVPNETSIALCFDGNTDTKASFPGKSLTIELLKSMTSAWAHVKLNTREIVKISFVYDGKTIETYYAPSENYQIKSVELADSIPLRKIILTSDAPFELFEIGLLKNNPVEFVEFDLKKPTQIGWITTRHFNGEGVLGIRLLWSLDGKNWTKFSNPEPMTTAPINHIMQPAVMLRYLHIEFVLVSRPYQKAKLYEIAAYSKNGPYGPRPEAKPATKTYNESLGINGFWGWSYNLYSDQLNNEQGPFLFAEIAELARNYHRIDWDINSPQDLTDFGAKKPETNKTGAGWLQWEREYQTWKDAGFDIDASITFEKSTFSDKVWIDPEKEAYRYGKAFADFFVKKQGLISTIEIGNEPWEYSSAVYKNILFGMSSGIKDVSPKARVFPCAIQAYNPQSDLKNYVSSFVTKKASDKLDGLNTHIYPYVFNNDGKRIAVIPEDPRSEVWSINNLIRFRDSNMPGKEIIVTEYGYDSDGGGEDCTHDECVSEYEQAIYGTRMALIFYRLGVDAFYWYFFANVDYHSMMHNRSGLTASYSGGFKKKAAFEAFKKLKNNIGDLYFKEVIMENDQAWVYAFADATGQTKKLIAWRPVATENDEIKWVDIPFKPNVSKAEFLANELASESKIPSFSKQAQTIRIGLSGNPVIISLH